MNEIPRKKLQVQGRVVQKQVNANLGLKVNQELLFLFLKSVSTASLKAAKVKVLDKRSLQESTSLSYKTELKIDANPRLA